MKKAALVTLTILCAIGLVAVLASCGQDKPAETPAAATTPAAVSETGSAGNEPEDVCPCVASVNGQVLRDITVAEADSMIKVSKNNPCFVLLDIRTRQEFDAGHLENALLIDFRDSTFSANIDKLDKNATYLLHCRTANRTTQSMRLFREKGFVEVYNMLGGVTEWKGVGLPGFVDSKGGPGEVIIVH